jgi:Ser/Thr protein kinase RdoA (MazF antagonist)
MPNSTPPFVLRNLPQLPSHLNDSYGIDVSGVTELDLGVLRIDRHDGPSWVARVFPDTRPLTDVHRDADTLARLERGGFPSERLVHGEPVTQFEGQGVLVTTFIPGVRPRGNGRTFAYIGSLLGRLHARDGIDLAPGGGWHHLVSSGTPKDEIVAVQAQLGTFGQSVASTDRKEFKALRAHVDAIDACDDLPHCFVHPDMVPVNAVEVEDQSLVIVDWTNAGRGPRLWSLGMTLFAAGARDIRLVEKVISRYVRHSSLSDEELARLDGAVSARPLTMHAWSIVHGRTALDESKAAVGFIKHMASHIGDAARSSFALERE